MNQDPLKSPLIVLVPGAAQTPSHYAHLIHLLQTKGYGTLTALLPSTAFDTSADAPAVTVQDDVDFIRKRMLLPVLDRDERDIILILHSYSGVPGTAAAKGLGRSERAAQGKKTSVLGQIFIGAIITRGGDGSCINDALGWKPLDHIIVDEKKNVLQFRELKRPVYNDVADAMASSAEASTLTPCYSTWTSPCPIASWTEPDFRGRVVYVRTLDDKAIPLAMQDKLLEAASQPLPGSGEKPDWIVKDSDSGHSPQLSQPEVLLDMLLGLFAQFRSS